MTQHASLFEAMGVNMFRGFAVILIVWFGVKSALGLRRRRARTALPFRSIRRLLLLTIAFGFGMITYYSQPIPGFGVSFYHLIIDQGLDLANQLNHSLVQELWDRLTGLYWGMETPGLTIALEILEILRYAITILCLLAAQAAILAVIAFGYVAAAIAVLLGTDVHSVFHRARGWSGSSGDGSNRSSSMPSIRSWPTPICSFSATCSFTSWIASAAL